jgi:hypothetical protein
MGFFGIIDGWKFHHHLPGTIDLSMPASHEEFFENSPQKSEQNNVNTIKIFLIKITTNEHFISHNNPLNYFLFNDFLKLNLTENQQNV